MFGLLTQRRFAPLFWTQFLSAFNDNFLKNALIFLIMFKLPAGHAQSLITLAGGLFILPFFLLSGIGGEMADRYDKALVAQRLKLVELSAAALSVAGFTLQSVPLLFIALVLFGTVAALFGPIKYGILPDHLQRHELPAGNALVEGATFVAILIGTLAGALVMRGGGDPARFAGVMIVISILCYGASLLIPKTGEAAPKLLLDPNIFRSTKHLLANLRADSKLWRAGVMVSLFWMFGIIALSLLPPTIKLQLGGDEMAVSLFLALFAVAVACGSGVGSYLCRDGIKLAPTPIATFVIGLSAADLAWALHGAAPPPSVLGVLPRLARRRRFGGHGRCWRRAGRAKLFSSAGLGAGGQKSARRGCDQCAQRRLHGDGHSRRRPRAGGGPRSGRRLRPARPDLLAFRAMDVQEFAEKSPARRLTALTAPRKAPVRRRPESHPEN